MSAAISKPELVRDGLPGNVAEAAIKRMEEDQVEISKLRRQRDGILARCELLQAQKNEIELRLSKQILSIHESYLDRITALEQVQDRTGNLLQPLVGLRDDVEELRAKLAQVASDYYAHSARSNC